MLCWVKPQYVALQSQLSSCLLHLRPYPAGTGYFGIYDGHGGRNVAEFLRLHLHLNIERELQKKGDRSVEECLKSAFLITDLECAATGEQASGSTAVVTIIRRQGQKRYVYTANCGDARAVLCHSGLAVRLSLDHKATDQVEKARIEAQGGFILRKRVMGVLAVARSFGDFVLKKFVTAEPYTSTTKLDGMVRHRLEGTTWWLRRIPVCFVPYVPFASFTNRVAHHCKHLCVFVLPLPFSSSLPQSQFIILACDGVWDVLEDQDAVDMVQRHLYGEPFVAGATSGSSGGEGACACRSGNTIVHAAA